MWKDLEKLLEGSTYHLQVKQVTADIHSAVATSCSCELSLLMSAMLEV